jgi:hypothetical protein
VIVSVAHLDDDDHALILGIIDGGGDEEGEGGC